MFLTVPHCKYFPKVGAVEAIFKKDQFTALNIDKGNSRYKSIWLNYSTVDINGHT